MNQSRIFIWLVFIGIALGLILGNLFSVADCSNTSRPILAALVGDNGCPKKFNTGWFISSVLGISLIGLVISKVKKD